MICDCCNKDKINCELDSVKNKKVCYNCKSNVFNAVLDGDFALANKIVEGLKL